MAFSIIIFIVGIVLLALGLLFVFKNKKVSSSYQGKILKNVYGKDVGESKGLGTYLRIRYFIAGILFIIVGLLLIWSAF